MANATKVSAKSGVCTAGKVGNQCFEQYQCAGLCSDNKCVSIAAGSVHPTESCKANSDCISERCVNTIQQKDENGINVLPMTLTSYQCDYFQNGQSGYRSYRDCDTGLCKSGTCTLGKDGDRCLNVEQCQNGSASHRRANKEAVKACKVDSNCFSGEMPTHLNRPLRPLLSTIQRKPYSSAHRSAPLLKTQAYVGRGQAASRTSARMGSASLKCSAATAQKTTAAPWTIAIRRVGFAA
ncbi:hypothetical protein CF326_g8451 [Tilletia indica]|nr:hypothetical protein CF326_g8451 [Tilletia indica]